MSYSDIKTKIDTIKDKIIQNGKLTKEQLNKINNKFRLEWNFNSNSMEGNTLTMEETRSVMVGNLDVRQKPIKDVLEMKGHDEVISNILKIGKGEMRLSEKRIKDIHLGIMHEENPDDKNKIGKWKQIPNEIINPKGEKYQFVNPELVQDRIHDLLNRTNAAIDLIQSNKKNAPHPIDVALEFHLEYLEIHPFYDGNGRTARILTNLILIALGYTPFWITKSERTIYYNYISDIQGYGGKKEAFYGYVSNLILRSEQLVLDVIDGKEIAEDDDLDKEIALLKRNLINKKDELVTKSNEVIAELYENTIRPLFSTYLEKLNHFDDLFAKKQIRSKTDSNNSKRTEDLEYFDILFEKIIRRKHLNDDELLFEDVSDPIKEIYILELDIYFEGFKHGGINTFGQNTRLDVIFENYSYVINDNSSYSNDDYILKKLYSEPLETEEIKNIVTNIVGKLLENIKSSIKNNK